MEESMEKINTVTVGVENVGEEDGIKIETEEDYIQLVRTVKFEQENSMDLGETVPSVCSETCLTVSADGSEVSDMRVEEVLHTQEEDHLPVVLPAVKAADKQPASLNTQGTMCDEDSLNLQNILQAVPRREVKIILQRAEYTFPALKNSLSCTDAPRVEHDLCCETHVRSADDSNEVSIKIEGEEIHIKDEDEPIAISFSSIKDEPERPRTEHQHVCAEDRPYACAVRNEDLNHQNDIEAHQHERIGQRPYACSVCNKTFSRKSNMKRHQVIHSGQRPYVCDVCEKTFTQKSDMKHHQVIHSGQRPYACNVCKKTFGLKSHMERHQLVHSGQRPYACDICKKTFSQKYHLKRHLLIHSG